MQHDTCSKFSNYVAQKAAVAAVQRSRKIEPRRAGNLITNSRIVKRLLHGDDGKLTNWFTNTSRGRVQRVFNYLNANKANEA